MSYLDFKKALKFAPYCQAYKTGGGADEVTIQRAEKMLGITFSKQCREFYKICNGLSFDCYDVWGVYPDKPEILADNAVGETLAARMNWGLPEKWVALQDDGDDGYAYYLDYSHLNDQGEPRVIWAIYTDGMHLEDELNAYFEEKMRAKEQARAQAGKDEDEYDEDDEDEYDEMPEWYCRYQIEEVVAEDLGQYLLEQVKYVLEESEE